MFDHLLESSRWDDSNKWSNIGFGQAIDDLEMNISKLSGALLQATTWSLMSYLKRSLYWDRLHVDLCAVFLQQGAQGHLGSTQGLLTTA